MVDIILRVVEENQRSDSPPHGWNNPADVREARRYCRGMQYGPVFGASWGRSVLMDMGQHLHKLGIDPKLAAEMIFRFTKPGTDSKWWSHTEIYGFTLEAYEKAEDAPGVLSNASGDFDNGDFETMEEESPLDFEGEDWPKPLSYDTKQNNATLFDAFREARPTPVISSDSVFYSLNAGKVWVETDDDALTAEMRQTDPTFKLDTSRLRMMTSAAHIECHTLKRPFEWLDEPHDAPAAEDLALFRNCVLDVTTGKQFRHDGRLFATGLPNFDFDPDAKCPVWDSFLEASLHPSYIPTLHEFMGYVLTPDVRQHKMLFLIGAPRSGKSTILDVMAQLVGPEHTMARTLSDLGGDFGLEGALDKKLMTIPDAHDASGMKRNKVLDNLKSISGGDAVSINRKNLKMITTKIPVRIALAANKDPEFIDEAGGLSARQLIIRFERSFLGREDRDLAAKLQAELPGIANRALEGLARLRAQGHFTVGERGRAAVREVTASHSPALRFAQSELKITGDAGDFVTLDDAYERYHAWALEEGLTLHERRSRDRFKSDLTAALLTRGVTYERRRWRTPEMKRSGKGWQKVRGFAGVIMLDRPTLPDDI